jgi:hypothetical protein
MSANHQSGLLLRRRRRRLLKLWLRLRRHRGEEEGRRER